MAPDAHLVDARLEHVDELVLHARPEQLEEYSQLGVELGAVVRRSISASDVAWALFCGGRLAALIGAIPVGRATPMGASKAHFVWVATTTVALERPVLVARWSRKLLRLLEQLGPLVSQVSVTFVASVRWLAWLGFRFAQPDASGFIHCWRNP